MKILFTTGIFPPDIGGPARVIERLAEDLSKAGFNIKVLTFSTEDEREDRGHYKVIKVSSKLIFLINIWKEAKKADALFVFDLYTAGFLSWLIGKKILSKKLVVRFAGDSAWESAYNKGHTKDDILSFQEKKQVLLVRLLKKIREKILKDADAVVAVSRFMKELAVKIGVSPEKVNVVYNSVDFLPLPTTQPENIRMNFNIPLENKIVITSGRLVPWKGVDGLIKAMATIKEDKSFPPVTLLVLGDGPEREKLIQLAKEKGVKDPVIFLGKISLEEILSYYKLADVFVLNSKYEGLSHVILEVLMSGIPVVASSSGGNVEVIKNGENGILIEYNNISEIVSAIKNILADAKWRSPEHIEICRKSLEKFNWSENIEKTIQIFKKITNAKDSFN